MGLKIAVVVKKMKLNHSLFGVSAMRRAQEHSQIMNMSTWEKHFWAEMKDINVLHSCLRG
jgi:hypothetical protein